MQPENLSDNALRMWGAYFLSAGSTLRFGGDHAVMEITPEARNGLDELLAAGAVEGIEPDDQWPGREHYGSTGMDLRPLTIERAGGKPAAAFKWLTEAEFITFKKKEGAPGKSKGVSLKFSSR